MRARAFLFSVIAGVACGEPSSSVPTIAPSDPACMVGSPDEDPVVELRALRADGSDVVLQDGDDLAVVFPPQGGRVALVGVRVRNVNTCGLQLLAALRDPVTRQLRLDSRTVNLQKQPDGWATTGSGARVDLASWLALTDYANVPLCPNQWADRAVFDARFELYVRVEDRRKRSAETTIAVVPRCAEPGARHMSCTCLCKRGYVLGEACGEDAGVMH